MSIFKKLLQAPVRSLLILAVTFGSCFITVNAQNQSITDPKSFFGFQMGQDRKLARWDQMVEYYNLIEGQSDRMKVVNMGETTLGNPFLALYISSPENLNKLDEFQKINKKLSDPRGIPQAELDTAVRTGRAVIVQSMGLHSNEVAASQMAVELVYDMLSRQDKEMQDILENTIAIMIPSFNPDGEIMVTDWYNKWIGTEYEGVGQPSLYHHYIGHDNNRDAYMLNTIESYYGAKIMFKDWIPQAYVDHHQMGPYGARMYVPPYSEPFRPNADPLVWREMSWYGAHIAYKEEENQKSGIVNAAIYSGWGHFGFHWITPFHNIAGMLTESAAARLATPFFVHPDQLTGSSRGMPKYEGQSTFPNPWPGGWWRLRDIVEQQKIAALATLDIAARNRETVLKTAYLKALRQTERGANGKTVAYVIPTIQHDKLTKDKLINVLLGQGVEVKSAAQAFSHEGRVYGAGTFVISMAQPKHGIVRWLLGQTNYPDNDFTRLRDGSPLRPYDMSTDNIAEYFGVRADPVSTAVSANLNVVSEDIRARGLVGKGSSAYVIDGRLNDAFTAVNLLWNAKVDVRRVHESSDDLNAGDFLVASNTDANLISQIATQTGVDFKALAGDATAISQPVNRQRIGMYQRYYGGNMDEGWTRLLLENFEFPYKTIFDKDMKNLNRKFDVIILPNDSVYRMTGDEKDKSEREKLRPSDPVPADYRSGFGDDGIKALQKFVEDGGILLTLGDSGEFAIKKFKLPLKNVVEKLSSKNFWSPGSTLRMNFDNQNRFAYGMPKESVGLFLGSNDVYQVVGSKRNHDIERIATFVDRDIMQSGWLLGEQHIAGKASMVSVKQGKGEFVLIGFRPQHRVQTHGTFKLVFNVLVSGPDG